MTPDEVARMVVEHDRILNADNGRFLRADVYRTDMRHLAEDVKDIKDTQRWALRLIVTEFLGLIVVIVIFVLNMVAP